MKRAYVCKSVYLPTSRMIFIQKLNVLLLRLAIFVFLSLSSSLLNAKSHEGSYSINILDFYTPVLSEAENLDFFENLMNHLKVYAVYCTREDAPKSVLRKEKTYISRGHSHIPDFDLKKMFRKKYTTEYHPKCQAREVVPESIDKNLIQLGSMKEYKYYDLIGFQIEISPSFMSQYTLLNNTGPNAIMQSIQSEGAQKGDYYFLVGKAERLFLPLEKVNSSVKVSYIKDVKKNYRGEELLKSVGLSNTPVSIVAVVTDAQGVENFELNEKFTQEDKQALIDRIGYDEMQTVVNFKNIFNIHRSSKVRGTYVKTPDAQMLHIAGLVDENSDWNKGIGVEFYETWSSYKGDVVSIYGNLESRNRFHCKVSYRLRFNPDGTSDKTFEVYSDYDVLKSYDGSKENIKNMKKIIQQYRYTQADDVLNECDKVVEYMQTIFSSSQKELSKKMQEMGDIAYAENTEQRKKQYQGWEKNKD